MTVVITHGIRKREFRGGTIPPDDLQVILGLYAKGIAVPIKGDALPGHSRLIKLYATTVAGARRIVFLIDVRSGTAFLLFYRGKNDRIGKNISIKNPEFRKALHAYLDLMTADIAAGAFASYRAE